MNAKCPCCDPGFHLVTLYGEARGLELYGWLQQRLKSFTPPPAPKALDQRSAILITYGDQFRRDGEKPLQTLYRFGHEYLEGLISGVHILPFYPSSSDDGFSVSDYQSVDPELGTWEDIHRLGERFPLMFDAVINHVSAANGWFKAFLAGDERAAEDFIVLPPDSDLSQVVRPRTSPLLTRFETTSGDRWVWTTFSSDQVDLNYRSPAVLKAIVDILLTYVERGARFLRLDAAAYLWKEAGTACIHLPQTHLLIQFLRAVLEQAAPQVALITETNVPHADNLSYFGNGYNEAHMVYNFALPPLVLHSFATGSAAALSRWASDLKLPSTEVNFFNFLASHDGIGLNPARGILSEAEIEALVQRTLAHGGRVSYKTEPEGSQSAYELNISYFDALSKPDGGEPQTLQVSRFVAAQAILLAMAGLPGIYIHSLLGSRNWYEGVRQSGRSRTINRRKFEYEQIIRQLNAPDSLPFQVFEGFARLLRARAGCPAFHPRGAQLVLEGGEAVFTLLRISPDGLSTALCLHNVSPLPQMVSLAHSGLPQRGWRDLLSGCVCDLGRLRLQGYQVMWLVSE